MRCRLSVLWGTRGPECEVRLGVERLTITMAAYVWGWAQKVPGLAMLTHVSPLHAWRSPPSPYSSCRQRPCVCTVLCS